MSEALTRGASRLTRPAYAVRIAGPDARRFANNMFTNNVRDMVVGAVNRHAYTDDRGRVQGFLDLICEGEDAFVALHDGPVEPFLERFEKYIVFDDVEMTPQEGWVHHLVVGPEARGAVGFEVPDPGRVAMVNRAFGWFHALGPNPTAAVSVVHPEADTLDVPRLTEDEFALLRILAGHPVHPVDTGAKALPHELGLRDVLLAFDKGCYLGQETINRVDVMGQVKRHLRVVLVDGVVDAEADIQLDTKSVGRLTSPVALPNGRTVGLAILKAVASEPDTRVSVGDAQATVLVAPVAAERLG
ncbi:MAG: hypothetical protein AAGA48_15480 [Myxococcota bacterium]